MAVILILQSSKSSDRICISTSSRLWLQSNARVNWNSVAFRASLNILHFRLLTPLGLERSEKEFCFIPFKQVYFLGVNTPMTWSKCFERGGNIRQPLANAPYWAQTKRRDPIHHHSSTRTSKRPISTKSVYNILCMLWDRRIYPPDE